MSTPAPSLSPLTLATGNPSGKGGPLPGPHGDGPQSFANVLRNTQGKAPDRRVQPVPVERAPADHSPAATDAAPEATGSAAAATSAAPARPRTTPHSSKDDDSIAAAPALAATDILPAAPVTVLAPAFAESNMTTTDPVSTGTSATLPSSSHPITATVLSSSLTPTSTSASSNIPVITTGLASPLPATPTNSTPTISTPAISTAVTSPPGEGVTTPSLDALLAQFAAGKAAPTITTTDAVGTGPTDTTGTLRTLIAPTPRPFQTLIKQAQARLAESGPTPATAAVTTLSPDNTATSPDATGDLLAAALPGNSHTAGLPDSTTSVITGFAAHTPPASATTAASPTALPAATGDFLLAEPANTQSQDFPDEIGTRLSWLAERNIGHAQIKVAPPELGAVDVRLKIDGHHVHLDFSSPHADVRAALEASLPRLRDMFQAQGMTLVQADVGQQAHDRGGEFATPRGEAGLFGGDAADDSAIAGTADIDTGLTRLRNGLLDEFA